MTERSNSNDYEKHVLAHYQDVAKTTGIDPTSTMQDQITRNHEVEAILRLLDFLNAQAETRVSTLLEVGCGNGYLLSRTRERFPQLPLAGIDYSLDMVALAKSRDISQCEIKQADVKQMSFPSNSFDVVVGERCIINLMDQNDQASALSEIARVLKPGGYYICIEAFSDGLEILNQARHELGLSPNNQPHHNLWFQKDWFEATIQKHFLKIDLESQSEELPPQNFLSSHYFISRVLYPSVTQREIIYNTLFVKFFEFLQPIGNFSPIQLFFLRKL